MCFRLVSLALLLSEQQEQQLTLASSYIDDNMGHNVNDNNIIRTIKN